MRRIGGISFLILGALALSAMLPVAGAAQPLVDRAWLRQHLGDQNLVMLAGSMSDWTSDPSLPVANSPGENPDQK